MIVSHIDRYKNYVETEIKYLGKVPIQWQVMRLKNVFRSFGSGGTPKSSEPLYYENGTVNWLNTGDLKNGLVSHTKNKITPIAMKECSLKIYPRGTLAIAMYGQGDTRGSVGLLDTEAAANQAACMMYGSRNALPKFMLWWFTSQKYSIRKLNVGATQPNMNQDFVKNLFIGLPTIKEQEAIG